MTRVGDHRRVESSVRNSLENHGVVILWRLSRRSCSQLVSKQCTQSLRCGSGTRLLGKKLSTAQRTSVVTLVSEARTIVEAKIGFAVIGVRDLVNVVVVLSHQCWWISKRGGVACELGTTAAKGKPVSSSSTSYRRPSLENAPGAEPVWRLDFYHPPHPQPPPPLFLRQTVRSRPRNAGVGRPPHAPSIFQPSSTSRSPQRIPPITG